MARDISYLIYILYSDKILKFKPHALYNNIWSSTLWNLKDIYSRLLKTTYVDLNNLILNKIDASYGAYGLKLYFLFSMHLNYFCVSLRYYSHYGAYRLKFYFLFSMHLNYSCVILRHFSHFSCMLNLCWCFGIWMGYFSFYMVICTIDWISFSSFLIKNLPIWAFWIFLFFYVNVSIWLNWMSVFSYVAFPIDWNTYSSFSVGDLLVWLNLIFDFICWDMHSLFWIFLSHFTRLSLFRRSANVIFRGWLPHRPTGPRPWAQCRHRPENPKDIKWWFQNATILNCKEKGDNWYMIIYFRNKIKVVGWNKKYCNW